MSLATVLLLICTASGQQKTAQSKAQSKQVPIPLSDVVSVDEPAKDSKQEVPRSWMIHKKEIDEVLNNRRDWGIVSMTDDSVFFYKKSTLARHVGGMVEVWIKTVVMPGHYGLNSEVVKERVKSGFPTKGYEAYLYSMSSYQLDCERRKLRVWANVNYNSEGRVIDSFEIDEDHDEPLWSSAVPESIGEVIVKQMCAAAK